MHSVSPANLVSKPFAGYGRFNQYSITASGSSGHSSSNAMDLSYASGGNANDLSSIVDSLHSGVELQFIVELASRLVRPVEDSLLMFLVSGCCHKCQSSAAVWMSCLDLDC